MVVTDFSLVMPALVAGNHVLTASQQGADGQDKPGHDVAEQQK
jgi:hypothetical protein